MAVASMQGVFTQDGLMAGKGYLYFLVTRDKLAGSMAYVKIGVSIDPLERMVSISTYCPLPIVKAAYVQLPNMTKARRLESELLTAFADRSTSGEWFRLDWANKEEREQTFTTIALHCSMMLPTWKLVEVDPQMVLETAPAIMRRRQLDNKRRRDLLTRFAA